MVADTALFSQPVLAGKITQAGHKWFMKTSLPPNELSNCKVKAKQ